MHIIVILLLKIRWSQGTCDATREVSENILTSIYSLADGIPEELPWRELDSTGHGREFKGWPKPMSLQLA